MGIADFLMISAASVFSGASAVVKASSVILTSVFELKATAFAWMRAKCPHHVARAFRPHALLESSNHPASIKSANLTCR
jgi:hypothetical protein